MRSEYRITGRDVVRAAEEVQRRKDIWQKYKFREVADRELEEAGTYVTQSLAEQRRLQSLHYRWLVVKLALLHVLEAAGLAPLAGPVVGLIGGTLAAVLAVIPLIALSNGPLPVLVGCLVCFLLTATLLAVFHRALAQGDVRSEAARLRPLLADHTRNLALLHERLTQWQTHRALLLDIRSAKREYEHALRRHQEMVQVLNSRQYQLMHTTWRSLRGIAFEDFIAEVFEVLGFRVTKTKASGDQGVDLIVEGRGRRIAVQVKGYAGSVGNKAVQEAHAGMTYYRCTESMVVTNSSFTSGACQLAQSVCCRLVDGTQVPDLIDGRLL